MSAHAPYNFIPLNETILDGELVDHHYYDANKNTGYFDVNLTTITPLFVRGMRGADMPDDTKISDPFMLDGKPVIHGSSLRGMIRALVEIITFGKMHFVDDANKIFFRAVAAKKDDPQGQFYKQVVGNPNPNTHAGKNVGAGYLVKDGDSWFIQPAQAFGNEHPFALVKDEPDKVKRVRGIRHLNDHNYQIVRFEVEYIEKQRRIVEVCTPKGPEYVTAFLLCTGNMAQTQSENQPVCTERANFVLVKKGREKTRLPIPQYVIDAYIQGLSPFQKGGKQGEEQSKTYFDEKNGILKEDNIVFYIQSENTVSHFGHTPNFRLAHYNADNKPISPRDFVPKKLLDPYFTDYADAIFGYVSDKGFKPTEKRPVAYSGRVSFTSATWVNGEVSYEKEIIRILGAPKPTTFQHYLEQQPDGVNTPKSKLRHYGNGEKIRGYKLYWRKGVRLNDLDVRIDDKDRPNVDVHLKPLREGLQFNFRVYFENLTNAELGALAWALSLDDTPDGNRHHMLGMAKPYGLGVVKLTVTALHISQRKQRYKKLFEDDGQWYIPKKDETTNLSEYITAFKTALKSTGIENFDEHERIQALFTMLKYYEPHSDFEYMGLGDFKERRVLDTPANIAKSKSLAKGDDK